MERPLHEVLLSLFGARSGHFRYESGHHGDRWLEIPQLYRRPSRLRRFAAALAQRIATHGVEAVCGPLVEGAFLAQMVAEELDVEFYFAEQIPRTRDSGLYPLGYRIPPTLRPSVRGKATAIVDDVINAASAVRGAFADLHACDARPLVIGALLVLGDSGPKFAASKDVKLESLAHIPSVLWEPSACPLCASGVPLEGVCDGAV